MVPPLRSGVKKKLAGKNAPIQEHVVVGDTLGRVLENVLHAAQDDLVNVLLHRRDGLVLVVNVVHGIADEDGHVARKLVLVALAKALEHVPLLIRPERHLRPLLSPEKQMTEKEGDEARSGREERSSDSGSPDREESLG
jgi:hypothetical protein